MNRMRKVRDVMTADVVQVAPGTPLTAAARLLSDHRVGGLPVVDGGQVVGVISESDLLAKEAAATDPDAPRRRWPTAGTRRGAAVQAALTVGQAMSSPAVTVGPDFPIGNAARLMVGRRLGRLPVVEAGRLVGIVTRGDLVRTFARSDADLIELVRRDVLLETMWLDPADFEVSVRDGVVVISGTVEWRTTAKIIERLIAQTPGVIGVEADLRWTDDDQRLPRDAGGLMAGFEARPSIPR